MKAASPPPGFTSQSLATEIFSEGEFERIKFKMTGVHLRLVPGPPPQPASCFHRHFLFPLTAGRLMFTVVVSNSAHLEQNFVTFL